MNLIIKIFAFILSFFLLSALAGCNLGGGTGGGGGGGPPSTTAQMVLKALADKKILELDKSYKGLTDASEIAKLTAQKVFLCDVLKLPAGPETKYILNDFLTKKVADATTEINSNCEGEKSLLAFFASRAPHPQDDSAKLKEMVVLLVDKGDKKTIESLDKGKLDNVLDAVKSKQPELTKVMKYTAPTLQSDLLDWSKQNPTPEVTSALAQSPSLISVKDVVDAAKEAAEASTEQAKKIKILSSLYDVKYIKNPGNVSELANEAPTGAAATDKDRFLHFLAKLDAKESKDIWQDYLPKLAFKGTPEVIKNLSAKGKNDNTPFGLMLAKKDSDSKDIVISMVEKAGNDVLGLITDDAQVYPLLDTVKEKKLELLKTLFEKFGAKYVETIVYWSFDQNIDNINQALKTSNVVNIENIVAEANKGPVGVSTGLLLYMYNTVIGDDGDKAWQLSETAVKGEKFSLLLAKLRADNSTAEIWGKYLAGISAYAISQLKDGPTEVTKQISEVVGGNSAFTLMIDDNKRPTGIVLDIEEHRNKIIATMVKEGGKYTIALADDPAKVQKMLDTVLAVNDAELLKTTFGDIDPKLDDAKLAWLQNNKDNYIVITALKETAAFTALAKAMVKEIMAEAAKGPGTTDTANLEKLYSAIDDDAVAQLAMEVRADKKRFIDLLAMLPADQNTVNIWNLYLTKINALIAAGQKLSRESEKWGPDALTDSAEGTTEPSPFMMMLDDNNRPKVPKDDKDIRNQIIAHMVDKIGFMALRKAVKDKATINKMLDAILSSNIEESSEIIRKAFDIVPKELRADLLVWIKANASQRLGYHEDVAGVFGNSEIKISIDELIDEIKTTKGTNSELKYLEALFNRYIDFAKGLQSTTPMKKRAKELAKWQEGGDYFIHFLVRLPARTETLNILNIFLHTDLDLNKADVIGKKDSKGKTALQILTPGEADTVREKGMLKEDKGQGLLGDEPNTLKAMQDLLK